MGNESTAIHDLLSGLSRKPIDDDPDDDLLFAGSRREPREARPPQQARAGMFTLPPPPPPELVVPVGPSPFAAPPFAPPPARMPSGTAPPPVGSPVQTVVPLPGPFQRQPTHALQHEATVRVGKSHAWALAAAHNKKLYAIPVGLFVVVVALLGIYATRDTKASAAAAAAPTTMTRIDAEPIEPAAVAAVEPAAAVAAVEPAAAAVEPVAAVEPAAAPAEPVAEVAPIAAEAAPEAPEQKQQNDLITPPTVVAASAFTARAEATVPTVTSTPIEAVATEAPAAAADDEVKVAPPAAKAKKKSRRELAREQRAAKRAAKRAKAQARVAAAAKEDRPEKAAKADKADKADKKEDLNGNGALAITSSVPREVWVDGRNSKRSTPLRVLLKPGKHTVTLFDKEHGSAKSFEIEIKPNATTKVSK